MIDKLCYFFIFFSGFLSLAIVLGTMLEKDKRAYHFFFGGIMFLQGALQLHGGLFIIEKFADYPAFIFWHIPAIAWCGPFFFFSFKSANQDSFRIRPLESLHFLTGFLIILLMAPLFTMDLGSKLSFLMKSPDIADPDPYFQLYSVLYITVTIITLVYMINFYRACFFMLDIRLIREKKANPLVIIMLLLLPFGFIYFGGMLVMVLLGYFRSYYANMIHLSAVLSFALSLVFFIMDKKKINFFKLVDSQIKERQYKISILKNLDISLVLSQIQSLMAEERIYHDESLTVNSMAERLAIKPYQLSRIINENFDKNFNSFVNEYRVAEAKNLFLNDGAATSISVAYAVGFNSTSVFNEWFKRITGVSPTLLRNSAKIR